MYGKNMDTKTLAKSLKRLSEDTCDAIDNGDHEDAEICAGCLMEGALVLWERIVKDDRE